jgi:hypothetical protein
MNCWYVDDDADADLSEMSLFRADFLQDCGRGRSCAVSFDIVCPTTDVLVFFQKQTAKKKGSFYHSGTGLAKDFRMRAILGCSQLVAGLHLALFVALCATTEGQRLPWIKVYAK